MKIGLDTAPVTLRGNYFQHLAGVLENYAPEHEYVVDAKRYGHLDLYHGFRSSLPLSVHLGRIPAVMTVPNLDFLRYPHLYIFSERLIALRLYRRALRQARRVITVSTPAREELSRRLRIDPAKIEVMMPLAARVPQEPPLQAELEHTRRKYGLPEMFILMIGTVESTITTKRCWMRSRCWIRVSGWSSAAAARSILIFCSAMPASGIWPRAWISSTS